MRIAFLVPQHLRDTATNQIPTTQGRFSRDLAAALVKLREQDGVALDDIAMFVLDGSTDPLNKELGESSTDNGICVNTVAVPGADFPLMMAGWEASLQQNRSLDELVHSQCFDVLCAGTLPTLGMAIHLKSLGLATRVLYVAHHLLRTLRHWGISIGDAELRWEHECLKGADAIVFPSDGQATLFDTYYGRLPGVRLETIYSGVPPHSPESFAPACPDSKYEVLFMASPMHAQSDFETALYVLRRMVAAYGRTVRLRIAGTPHLHDHRFAEDPAIRRLVETAANLGLLRYIEFVGVQDRQAMWRSYQSASVTLITSVVEAYGDIFVESVLEGTPAVGSAVGAMPNFAALAPDLGVVASPRAPQEFASGVFKLLKDDMNRDDRERRERTARARRTILEQFSWEAAAGRYLELFDELIDAKHDRTVESLYRTARVRDRLKARLDSKGITIRSLYDELNKLKGKDRVKHFESVRRVFDEQASPNLRWSTVEPVAKALELSEPELREMEKWLKLK